LNYKFGGLYNEKETRNHYFGIGAARFNVDASPGFGIG
jgi:hypothetical protein